MCRLKFKDCLAAVSNVIVNGVRYEVQTWSMALADGCDSLNGQVPTGAVVNIANIEVQAPSIPEPATIGLLAIGGLGLLLLGRRRKSA